MLDFSIGTMLFQLIVVILLILIVSKFAARPVLEMMKKRQDHIDKQLSDAENAQKEAAALLEEQRAELKKTREEAQVIIESEKKRAEAEAHKIIDQAKAQAERTIQDAREEIKLEKERAITSLRDEVAQLSMLLAAKVLEREVNEKDHEQEIDTFIKQVGDRL
ncbi:F0F1 ATP synthase subunit B [Camelliibacillus cellulosilyticus]|uniref:ATP synthase subunit b n=1 Tax=Camelliibacillus cellulosilyticus TaxID=2174486 RepID=A0ABV9GNL9_9BACL